MAGRSGIISRRGNANDEALGFAVLALMGHLAPVERAAYVLREAFDYPYARIAGIVDKFHGWTIPTPYCLSRHGP
ncbi:MAG TPA: sigma factor-like helix-turn-helix DNA-binding protein [Thermomicrobiales bacterium]|jgi:hypothetical protein|nr:sigma factor-like helix-turn-helix DNA-binding protein [Thermomicrobiales bacterium]